MKPSINEYLPVFASMYFVLRVERLKNLMIGDMYMYTLENL